MRTPATDVLGIELPIVQGGLARVAGHELCAAVSEAGGLGQIATAGLEGPEALRAEIRACRARTAKPFGVNLLLGRFAWEPWLDVALEEGVGVIALTAGNPAPPIRRIAGRARVLVLTAGPELARKAEGAGADIVATVGFEGGGHIGRTEETTLVMVPRVVDAVRIPVLASGGIADGRGLAAALALGAAGAEMGTRFVATREARAHPAYKRAIAAAAPEDTVVIKRSLGQPGRVLRTAHAARVLEAEARGEDVGPLVAGAVNARGVRDGDLEESYLWAGQCAGLIGDEAPPAGEVVRRIAADARAIVSRLGRVEGAQHRLGLPDGGDVEQPPVE